MLYLPEQSYIFRFISIDPGSNTLGLSIFELDINTKQLTLINTSTLIGERNSRNDLDNIEIHGNKLARLFSHQRSLLYILNKYNPHAVICESAYMGRFPTAFGVLTETIAYLRQIVYNYDPYMHFELIDPSSAKKAIGAEAKGKGSVREVVLKLIPSEINYIGNTPINCLDEHGYDSIIIGYYKYKLMLEYLR